MYVISSPALNPLWPLHHPRQGWLRVVYQQGGGAQTSLWSRVHNAGFSLRSPQSQALNDSFINVFKCSLCPFQAMSDVEEAWINKTRLLPSRNPQWCGSREGRTDWTGHQVQAWYFIPHSRNDCPIIDGKIRKSEVTGPRSLNGK